MPGWQPSGGAQHALRRDTCPWGICGQPFTGCPAGLPVLLTSGRSLSRAVRCVSGPPLPHVWAAALRAARLCGPKWLSYPPAVAEGRQ